METDETKEIVVKKEPIEGASEDDENTSQSSVNESLKISAPEPLRYVSRRGRPPGGGYSMKSHAHYISFSSTPLVSPSELGHPASMGSTSSLSPEDLLKTGASGSSDGLDIRRFGFQGFDAEKNSFRCDGCDVVFSSRDTYAMHMLLRAKNESCVALPTSAISSNPENPTPREKFERELRQQAMITALRNQAAAMSKAAAAMIPKPTVPAESLSSLARSQVSPKDETGAVGGSGSDVVNFNSLFSVDAYGLYVDSRQYRRFLAEYGLRASTATGSLVAMMEQLSCGVCGELFSNKDSLAMHMMYHTRDEEKEKKPNITWAEMRLGGPKNESTSMTTKSSTATTVETPMNSKTDTNSSRKRGDNQPEDKQLTAERIAELKRMAIESSLRSASKKSSQTLKNTRPKSVSEDMAVTSSANARPLSADDAIRFSKSDTKTRGSSQEPGLVRSQSYVSENHRGTGLGRKRHSLTAEDDPVCEVRHVAMDALKHKRMRYEGDHNDIFPRNTKHTSQSGISEKQKNFQVYDDHVSSATGPQDSDETSEGSYVADQESVASSEDKTKQSGTRPIPYLDAIMSQDAVLVPLENLETDAESEKIPDRRHGDGYRTKEVSALDYSLGMHPQRESFSRTNWYSAQNGREGFSTDVQIQAYEPSDRGGPRRTAYNQQQNTNGHAENRANPGTNRASPMSRSSDSVSDQQGNDGPTRNRLNESPSRGGEARYCPHCEILFLDVTLFHLHMGLHNVNNPWQCNTCGLVCSGRLEFNTHVLHY